VQLVINSDAIFRISDATVAASLVTGQRREQTAAEA